MIKINQDFQTLKRCYEAFCKTFTFREPIDILCSPPRFFSKSVSQSFEDLELAPESVKG